MVAWVDLEYGRKESKPREAVPSAEAALPPRVRFRDLVSI